MTTQIVMPKLGFSMNEGTIAEWLVDDGAAVIEGQPLFSLESEKAVEEVASPASGTLKILVEAGQLRQIGAVIAEIL